MPINPEMDRVSRPLLGLLLATVVFFALWIFMLKPGASSSGGDGTSGATKSGTGPGLGQLGSAISAAHNAVGTANAASARQGGGALPANGSAASSPKHPTAPPATAPASAVTASAAHPSATAAVRSTTTTHVHVGVHHHASRHISAATAALLHRLTPTQRERAVIRALRAHRVVAMLFFNPAGADDRSVRAELASIPTHHGRVLVLAAPLSELSSYPSITAQVPITGSPTLVVIDRTGGAVPLVGFQARFAIEQTVQDAYLTS